MNNLDAFVYMSRRIGQRFDLVQAGGGNCSTKISETEMLVKASGAYVSDVNHETSYAKVNYKQIVQILSDKSILQETDKRTQDVKARELVSQAISPDSPKGERPSIETFLHALLATFVSHTHPILVNGITSQENGESIISNLFPEALSVTYKTPGIELAIELKKQVDKYYEQNRRRPEIIFLKNHGLIVSGDTFDDIQKLSNHVLRTIATYLNVDHSRFELIDEIATIIESISSNTPIVYLSEDKTIYNRLNDQLYPVYKAPICPDDLVYCGPCSVTVKTVNELQQHITTYGELPKVITYKDHLFFLAKNIKKAKELEEMLRFHIMTTNITGNNTEFLCKEEINYLGNWEAEKYRREK